MLWTNYKNGLGVSEFTDISYNLSILLLMHNLEDLDADFNDIEIGVIKNLPNSDAPGPDGFNGLFIKKYWNFIKDDFIRLFKDFCDNNINLSSINSSFIALIPKKENPENIDDYMPISLLNYSLKCITKILSSTLQKSYSTVSSYQPIWVHQGENYTRLSGMVISISTFMPQIKKGNCYSKDRL